MRFCCGICYQVLGNSYRSASYLPCGHAFCTVCCWKLVAQFPCPLCRRAGPIESTDIRPIQLTVVSAGTDDDVTSSTHDGIERPNESDIAAAAQALDNTVSREELLQGHCICVAQQVNALRSLETFQRSKVKRTVYEEDGLNTRVANLRQALKTLWWEIDYQIKNLVACAPSCVGKELRLNLWPHLGFDPEAVSLLSVTGGGVGLEETEKWTRGFVLESAPWAAHLCNCSTTHPQFRANPKQGARKLMHILGPPGPFVASTRSLWLNDLFIWLGYRNKTLPRIHAEWEVEEKDVVGALLWERLHGHGRESFFWRLSGPIACDRPELQICEAAPERSIRA
ncbi:hypothetical protein FA13DRAFT_1717168 [Coprinellus micaceus]|uniref:RING-type domain-containing protein n=1 Tax=Coprinellus micaceus TaxID=71717 RepID=A0A4Y7SH18_COPMI|nr:hypothetical protein FA13DRAFT_1717168 [Coprinellus micaceus]